ncbi:MAG: hypothetical protein HDT32_03410 [Clostridiales bacterium]|nr:hypothetical protein [Clostridiales bacterium]
MLKTFQVFNDEAVGRIFLPDGFSYENTFSLHISPFHGRAIAVRRGDFDWISVKGGGWNYGGPHVYLSQKDEELIFGLYPSMSAERELAVSRAIEDFSDDFPKVLYYKRLSDYDLPRKYCCLTDVKFKNGTAVDPCLLYTQVKCPCRVADLMYFTDEKKRIAVEQCCRYWGISSETYLQKFIQTLALRVATLHKHAFINDTLDYGNVTLLAEVIDYEWVTAHGIKLFDGTYGLEIREERKEKELLYGAEVCLQLAALLQREYNLFDIYKEFIDSYATVNPDFVNQSVDVQKMLRREEFII